MQVDEAGTSLIHHFSVSLSDLYVFESFPFFNCMISCIDLYFRALLSVADMDIADEQ